MTSVLVAALEAITLEPPADVVCGPLLADLSAALEHGRESDFLSAAEGHSRALARRHDLRMADVFSAVRDVFDAVAGALDEASPGVGAVARERLRRLEGEALVRAGIGFADGLEEEIDQLSAEVDYLRPEDPVTGVMKESEILRRMTVEAERCRRMDMSLGLALVSIDSLDEIRRRSGPGEPTEFLRRVARLLAESLRQYDVIGRRGEERFLVVLPDVSRRGLQSVVERFRHDLVDECPSTLHARFGFVLAHFDLLDLSVPEMLEQLEAALGRARGDSEEIAWV